MVRRGKIRKFPPYNDIRRGIDIVPDNKQNVDVSFVETTYKDDIFEIRFMVVWRNSDDRRVSRSAVDVLC